MELLAGAHRVPSVWSILAVGAGCLGAQSDRRGSAPKKTPIHTSELIFHRLTGAPMGARALSPEGFPGGSTDAAFLGTWPSRGARGCGKFTQRPIRKEDNAAQTATPKSHDFPFAQGPRNVPFGRPG